jgi:hypothetical protein
MVQFPHALSTFCLLNVLGDSRACPVVSPRSGGAGGGGGRDPMLEVRMRNGKSSIVVGEYTSLLRCHNGLLLEGGKECLHLNL